MKMLVNNQGKALVVNGNALVVDDSNIIYQLYNHTCDGTAATAINTGIYLFDTTLYPNGWDITFDFTVNQFVNSTESYLRCRNSTSPNNGFSVRRDRNYSTIQAQSNGTTKSMNILTGTRLIATVEKPTSDNKLKVTVGEYGGSPVIAETNVLSVVSPLVIGGELSNDTTQAWNPDRFSKITVHSLIITSK